MKWSVLILLVAGAIAALAFVLIGGPAPGDVMVRTGDVSFAELDRVPPERWQAVRDKRVFFGHQSVGRDILAGMAAIGAGRPATALRVVHGAAEALGDGPGLAELEIGANSDPEAKIRDFADHVKADGARLDVAFMKLCYVDVTAATDVDALFATYRAAMAVLAETVPGTRLLHCTVPLTAIRTDWKAQVKRMLGKVPPDDADNRARLAFNARMRAEYGTAGTLIDLAAAESTLPDGSAVTWQSSDAAVPVLAECYTTDGGHLDEVGRLVVARHVLRRLQEVAGGK